MSGPITWGRYLARRVEYSVSLAIKNYNGGQITHREVKDVLQKNLFRGKLTYYHYDEGEEMERTRGTLLVRKIPAPDPSSVFVGDVVVLKDPRNPDKHLVRRLAALEGDEMVSTDEKDAEFILGKNLCWVVADNERLLPKEAKDSRTFGPVPLKHIVGRVIYCLRSVVDFGPVNNSHFGTRKDKPILSVELNVMDMINNHKL